MSDTQTDPVEAVARDMARRDGNTNWTFLSKKCQIAYCNDARAAIAAYREALEAAGWQVVPKSMTAMMFAAADEERNPDDMWSQALQAAPTPEDRDDE